MTSYGREPYQKTQVVKSSPQMREALTVQNLDVVKSDHQDENLGTLGLGHLGLFLQLHRDQVAFIRDSNKN